MDTPRTYILQLCTYLTNDADVALHCNRNFGTAVKPARVAEIRASMPARPAPGPQGWIAKEPYRGDKYKKQEDAIRSASARLAGSIRATHG